MKSKFVKIEHEKKFKQVGKKEFEKFIKQYPNKIISHRICDSPLVSYTDSSGKNGVIVAQIIASWIGPKGEIDRTDHKRFYILNQCHIKEILNETTNEVS